MDTPQIYIIISMVVLAIIAALLFFVKKKREKLTPLAGVAFGFIVAGIVFSDDRWIGYSLMGVGIALAIIDIIRKSKRK